MTDREKRELLLQDLSARVPFGVIAKCGQDKDPVTIKLVDFEDEQVCTSHYLCWDSIDIIKPYLRPLSSMTEEERKEMSAAIQRDRVEPYGEIKSSGVDNLLLCTARQATNLIVWFNMKHFDYRGLIEKGLAIAVTEENNPYK